MTCLKSTTHSEVELLKEVFKEVSKLVSHDSGAEPTDLHKQLLPTVSAKLDLAIKLKPIA